MSGEEARGGADNGSEQPDLTRVFHDLLAQHPEALVVAVGYDGLFVPMPATVPLAGHRVVVGRSAIDMVVPGDKVTVITTWERCRFEGASHAVVHLVSAPERPVMMTLVDARDHHGVFLGMFVPTLDPTRASLHPSAVSQHPMPRTARVRKTELAVISDIDAATTRILGWTAEDMVGRRSLEFVHPDDQERAISNWMEMLTAPGHDQRVRLRQLKSDGTWVWMELTNRNLLETEGEGCVLTEMLDISEELAAQEALRASEQLLRRLAESLPLGVVQIDVDGRITYANERAGTITGARASVDVDAQFRHVVGADDTRLRDAIGAVLHHGEDQDIHARFDLGAIHGLRTCTLSMRALTGERGSVTGAIVCVSDVTEQERMTAELARQATYDPVTACHNRRSVMSILEERLRAPGAGIGLIFVDLDGFKQVNDTLGHAAGDALLAGVGLRLRDALRPGDVVGRVGGDEFLVVCAEIADEREVRRVADRIAEALAAGVCSAEGVIPVHASLGVAHTVEPASSGDRLVAEADAAMYVAKRERRDAARAVDGASDRPSSLRTRGCDQELELQWAIDNDELEVHFQPVVELASRSVRGLEALVRWRRDGEMIPAVAFIELAERTGLIVDIGRRIVDEVCRQAAAHGAARDLQWFVNLSPRELAAPDALRTFLDTLERHEVAADRVVVEVTEHADLSSSLAAQGTVRGLAASGVRIALDDFGTGYSSLALLRSLPIDGIKVDRSFTADLGSDPVAGHLLDVCSDLARRLDLALVVEGVETEAQAGLLADAGVELVQGYLFSPPRPIAELRAQLLGGPLVHRVG